MKRNIRERFITCATYRWRSKLEIIRTTKIITFRNWTLESNGTGASGVRFLRVPIGGLEEIPGPGGGAGREEASRQGSVARSSDEGGSKRPAPSKKEAS